MPLMVRRSPVRLLAATGVGVLSTLLFSLAIRAELEGDLVDPATADGVALSFGCLVLVVGALLLRGEVLRVEVDELEVRVVGLLRPAQTYPLHEHSFRIHRPEPLDEPGVSDLVVHLPEGRSRTHRLKFGEAENMALFTGLVERKRAVDLLMSPLH